MRSVFPAILLMMLFDTSHAQTAVKLCDLMRNPQQSGVDFECLSYRSVLSGRAATWQIAVFPSNLDSQHVQTVCTVVSEKISTRWRKSVSAIRARMGCALAYPHRRCMDHRH